MATEYTYSPEGHRAQPKGSPVIEVDTPLLGLQEQVFEISLDGAESNDTHTITLPWDCRVIDAWCTYSSGYATSVDQITWGDGTHDITDAIDFTHASTAGTIDRATKIVPTYATLRKGDTLVGTVGTVTGSDIVAKAYVRVLVLPTSEQ